MNVNANHISEIKALIESGDVSLLDERAKFKRVTGEDTVLNDENLIRAIAATDDDDEDLFVKNVLAIQDEVKQTA